MNELPTPQAQHRNSEFDGDSTPVRGYHMVRHTPAVEEAIWEQRQAEPLSHEKVGGEAPPAMPTGFRPDSKDTAA